MVAVVRFARQGTSQQQYRSARTLAWTNQRQSGAGSSIVPLPCQLVHCRGTPPRVAAAGDRPQRHSQPTTTGDCPTSAIHTRGVHAATSKPGGDGGDEDLRLQPEPSQ